MATDKAERLVNLVVALLEARRPLTLADLRARTREYTQDDTESARRQFERDKDDLRRLGVPVESTDLDLGGEIGYAVDRRAYELPDVELTPEEVAALALAVRLTGQPDHQRSWARLAARAPDPAEVQLATAAPAAPQVDLGLDPVDATLADALVRHVPLRFGYRTAAGQEADRHVDPYAVVQRRGAWYLVAHDHDRDDRRAFRLDRIVGGRARPSGEPGSFVPPTDLDVAAAVSGPETERITVRLAVRDAARWDVEVRGGVPVDAAAAPAAEDATVYDLPGLDPLRDRAWLLGLGAGIEVLAPPEARAAIAEGHVRTAAAHGGSA